MQPGGSEYHVNFNLDIDGHSIQINGQLPDSMSYVNFNLDIDGHSIQINGQLPDNMSYTNTNYTVVYKDKPRTTSHFEVA